MINAIGAFSLNLFLGGMYVLVLTPVGVVARRLRDPLNRQWDATATSYRTASKAVPREHLERMFL